MTTSAIILFAHGSRDPLWAEPMRRVRSAVLASKPTARVELAFLEHTSPSLAECAARLVSEGARHIVVLPLFLAQGNHLKQDAPVLVSELKHTHPGVRFELTTAIGEVDSVIGAMASHVVTQLLND